MGGRLHPSLSTGPAAPARTVSGSTPIALTRPGGRTAVGEPGGSAGPSPPAGTAPLDGYGQKTLPRQAPGWTGLCVSTTCSMAAHARSGLRRCPGRDGGTRGGGAHERGPLGGGGTVVNRFAAPTCPQRHSSTRAAQTVTGSLVGHPGSSNPAGCSAALQRPSHRVRVPLAEGRRDRPDPRLRGQGPRAALNVFRKSDSMAARRACRAGGVDPSAFGMSWP